MVVDITEIINNVTYQHGHWLISAVALTPTAFTFTFTLTVCSIVYSIDNDGKSNFLESSPAYMFR